MLGTPSPGLSRPQSSARAVLRQLQPGSTVDGLTIVRELGRGGMGVVLLAHDSQNREVVIKLALEAPAGSPAYERFRREALLLAKLKHPNVVSVKGAGEFQGVPYFVMDFVTGQSLDEELRESLRSTGQPPDAERTRSIFMQLAEALQACHAAGIVHRDLKPDNILITEPRAGEASRAMLVDFGIAKLDPAAAGETLESLTRSGQMVGTPSFMAPEQVAAGSELGEIGPHSDVWGFGASLFFALTGETPYDTRSAVEFAAAVSTREPRRASSVSGEVPGWLDFLCSACLRREGSERPSLDQVLEVLRSRQLRPLRRAEHRGRQRAFAGLALVLLAGSLGGTWWMTRDREAPVLTLDQEGKEVICRTPRIKLSGTIQDAQLPAFVLINGQRVRSNAAGRFKINLRINPKSSLVELIPVDSTGNRGLPKQLHIRFDRRPPRLSIDRLPADSGGELWIEGSVDEDRCEVSLGASKAVMNGRHFRLLFKPKPAKNPPSLRALDAAGNITTAPLPLFLVSNEGFATHRNLGSAIEVAPPNATILLRPGEYRGSYRIVRPLRILGSKGAAPRIHSQRSPAFLVTASLELRNLSLEQQSMEHGIALRGGDLSLDSVKIVSKAKTVIAMTKGLPRRAQQLLQMRNTSILVEEAKSGLLLQSGTAKLQGCVISGNGNISAGTDGRALIRAANGVRLELRDCLIERSQGTGIELFDCDAFLDAVAIVRSMRDGINIRNGMLRAYNCAIIHSNLEGLESVFSDTLFENCLFHEVGNGGSKPHTGLRFRDQSRGQLRRCLFSMIPAYAVGVTNGARVTIESSEFVRIGFLPYICTANATLSLDGKPISPAPSPPPPAPGVQLPDVSSMKTEQLDQRLRSLSAFQRRETIQALIAAKQKGFQKVAPFLQGNHALLMTAAGRVFRAQPKAAALWLGRCLRVSFLNSTLHFINGLSLLGPNSQVNLLDLQQALRFKEPRARQAAAKALACLSPKPETAKQIATLLKDSKPGVRAAAALSLGRLGSIAKAEAEPIEALLEMDNPLGIVAALRALETVPPSPRGYDRLSALAQSPNAGFRSLAVRALLVHSQGSTAAMSTLDRGILTWPRAVELSWAHPGPGGIGAERLRRLVPKLSTLRNPEQRRAILRRLGAVGSSGLKTIEASLNSSEPPTRRAAYYALGALGSQARGSLERLISSLQAPTSKASPAERRALIWALSSIGRGDPRVPVVLNQALKSERDPLLRAALKHSLIRCRVPEGQK